MLPRFTRSTQRAQPIGCSDKFVLFEQSTLLEATVVLDIKSSTLKEVFDVALPVLIAARNRSVVHPVLLVVVNTRDVANNNTEKAFNFLDRLKRSDLLPCLNLVCVGFDQELKIFSNASEDEKDFVSMLKPCVLAAVKLCKDSSLTHKINF